MLYPIFTACNITLPSYQSILKKLHDCLFLLKRASFGLAVDCAGAPFPHFLCFLRLVNSCCSVISPHYVLCFVFLLHHCSMVM